MKGLKDLHAAPVLFKVYTMSPCGLHATPVVFESTRLSG